MTLTDTQPAPLPPPDDDAEDDCTACGGTGSTDPTRIHGCHNCASTGKAYNPGTAAAAYAATHPAPIDLDAKLNEYEEAAARAADWCDGDRDILTVAAVVVPHLLAMVRAVTDLHPADDEGIRCRGCMKPWPCPDIDAIYAAKAEG